MIIFPLVIMNTRRYIPSGALSGRGGRYMEKCDQRGQRQRGEHSRACVGTAAGRRRKRNTACGTGQGAGAQSADLEILCG